MMCNTVDAEEEKSKNTTSYKEEYIEATAYDPFLADHCICHFLIAKVLPTLFVKLYNFLVVECIIFHFKPSNQSLKNQTKFTLTFQKLIPIFTLKLNNW